MKGELYSWGAGSSGQLGHGDKANLEEPKKVEGLVGKDIVMVYCNAAHSAALSSSGYLYTWGWLGGRESEYTPQLVEGLIGETILQVSLGAFHIIALVKKKLGDGGNVYTWGTGNKGQLGHGNLESQKLPTMIGVLSTLNIVSVSASESHSACLSGMDNIILGYWYSNIDKVIVAAGEVFIWGSNEDRVLGVPVDLDIVSCPTAVEGLRGIDIAQIKCGLGYTAAVTTTGALFTWGRNRDGQLGHASPEEVISVPQQVIQLFGAYVEGVTCGSNTIIAWTSTFITNIYSKYILMVLFFLNR